MGPILGAVIAISHKAYAIRLNGDRHHPLITEPAATGELPGHCWRQPSDSPAYGWGKCSVAFVVPGLAVVNSLFGPGVFRVSRA